jgi:hypothetical protein
VPSSVDLFSLAIVLRDQGDLAGARPLFERALAICEKTLGPEHRNTASSLSRFHREIGGSSVMFLILVVDDEPDVESLPKAKAIRPDIPVITAYGDTD